MPLLLCAQEHSTYPARPKHYWREKDNINPIRNHVPVKSDLACTGIFFHSKVFVRESIIFFANIPLCGHPTPRLHRQYMSNILYLPGPPVLQYISNNIGNGNIL